MNVDVVIVGGGHNGLVAAALLARRGLKTLVLERRDDPGGCVTMSEIAPGFRCPTLAHRASLDPAVIRLLALEREGLEVLRPAAHVTAPARNGRALTIWTDPARAAAAIAPFSARDAERYPQFVDAIRRISRVLRAVLSAPAPDLDAPGAGDLLSAFGAVRSFRALGRRDAPRLLRWLTMPVADLVGEWFESEPLSAAIAAGGVIGSFLGPRSPGSGAVLLLLGAGEGQVIAPGWTAAGGIGRVTETLATAARRAGAEIRTGVMVARIGVADGRATGVVLANGDEIAARAVVSALSPTETLLTLIDPIHMAPGFLQRVRNIRVRGTLAKVNFAASSLPQFRGLLHLGDAERQAALGAPLRLAASMDAIERAFDAAKYGGFADEPWIELTIPSVLDPTLAPAGQHVVSAYVQFTPRTLRGSSWDAERERLGEAVTRTIASYAPGFEETIRARQVITPLDLEAGYGLPGGHIFHGELALDQLFVARPLLGWARHATPIRQLFLCSVGTHPGTGADGRPGLLAARAVLRALRGLQ